MPLPVLDNWEETRTALHQAARVLSVVRLALSEPEPNWLHVALHQHPAGLTTTSIPGVGEFILDFAQAKIQFTKGKTSMQEFSLEKYTQQSLAGAVEQAVSTTGTEVSLNREKLPNNDTWRIDPVKSASYRTVLHAMIEALENFRMALPAERTTPVVVWGHGFDASFLWFATDQTTEEEPHMGFGFSPGSEGHENPYLYTYPWPVPEDLTGLSLPSYTHWTTTDYTGTHTPYAKLQPLEDPIATVRDILAAVHRTVSPYMNARP